MKQINFRIIELPDYQVLLTKDYDEENDAAPLLGFSFFTDDVKITHDLGYKSEITRNEIFESMTEEQAQTLINHILALFN